MPKKRKLSKDGLGAGTFVRFDAETRVWLEEKAKADGGRSLSSMLRKIVQDEMNRQKELAAKVFVHVPEEAVTT